MKGHTGNAYSYSLFKRTFELFLVSNVFSFSRTTKLSTYIKNASTLWIDRLKSYIVPLRHTAVRLLTSCSIRRFIVQVDTSVSSLGTSLTETQEVPTSTPFLLCHPRCLPTWEKRRCWSALVMTRNLSSSGPG